MPTASKTTPPKTKSSRKRTSPATRKSATSKPKTATKARTPATPKTPAPVVVEATKPMPTGPDLKRQELFEKVARKSGVKKQDVKPVVEAMLAVMGEALAEGRGLNLEPFGKSRVTRVKEMPGKRMSVVKLRQKTEVGAEAEKDKDDPLASVAE